MSQTVMRALLVAVGGLCGSLARYWMSGAVQNLNDGTFPFGTLSVNLLGSFLVSLIMILSVERGLIGAHMRIALTIGFCGGFTTMSTFSYETFMLLRAGTPALAFYNLASNFGGCLAAVWVGVLVARWL